MSIARKSEFKLRNAGNIILPIIVSLEPKVLAIPINRNVEFILSDNQLPDIDIAMIFNDNAHLWI